MTFRYGAVDVVAVQMAGAFSLGDRTHPAGSWLVAEPRKDREVYTDAHFRSWFGAAVDRDRGTSWRQEAA